MFVELSITGVAVVPIAGWMSEQLMSPGFHGPLGARSFDHCWLPVAGSNPYTSSFSVATISVPVGESSG